MVKFQGILRYIIGNHFCINITGALPNTLRNLFQTNLKLNKSEFDLMRILTIDFGNMNIKLAKTSSDLVSNPMSLDLLKFFISTQF